MPADNGDLEHWPSHHLHFVAPEVAAAGDGGHIGLHPHTYLAPAPLPCLSPPPSQTTTSDPTAARPLYIPVYHTHHLQQAKTYPHQPQYYSHPPQHVMYMGHPPPHDYYTGVAPPLQTVPIMVAASESAAVARDANFHLYQPAYSNRKTVPESKESAPVADAFGNVWLGRTKAQVDEDNMKIAKREGAYKKHKIVPVDVDDDQIFWVVEPDGSHSLRDYRYIKEVKGVWKEDPRFEDSYYFVREEHEDVEGKKQGQPLRHGLA